MLSTAMGAVKTFAVFAACLAALVMLSFFGLWVGWG
jgi:hypothetical protein